MRFLSYIPVTVPRTAMLVKSSMNTSAPIIHVSTRVRLLFVAYLDSISASAFVAPVRDHMPSRHPNSSTKMTYHAVSALPATPYIRSMNPPRKPVPYCRMQQTAAPISSEDVVLRV